MVLRFDRWKHASFLCSGFTRRTVQNTHNAAGWGVGTVCPWMLYRSPAHAERTVSADTGRSVLCCLLRLLCNSERRCTRRWNPQFTWWFLKLSWGEWCESAAWMTTADLIAVCQCSYVVKTTAFLHAVLHLAPSSLMWGKVVLMFADVIKINIKMSS